MDVFNIAMASEMPTKFADVDTVEEKPDKLLPLMFRVDVAVPVVLSTVTPSIRLVEPWVSEIVLLLIEFVKVPVGTMLNAGT